MNYKQIIDRLDIELKISGRLKLQYYIPSSTNPSEFVTYEFVREDGHGLLVPGSVPISIVKEVLAFYQPNRFQCETMNGKLSFSRAPSRSINMPLGDSSSITTDIDLDTEMWRYIEYRANEMQQLRMDGKSTYTNTRYHRLPQEIITLFAETKEQQEDKKLPESKTLPSGALPFGSGLNPFSSGSLPSNPFSSGSNPFGSNTLGTYPTTSSLARSDLISLLSTMFGAPSSGNFSMYSGFPSGIEAISFSYPQPSNTHTFTQEEYDSLPRRELSSFEKEYIAKYKIVEEEAAKLPGLEKSAYEIKEKGKLDAQYSGLCQIKNITCPICLEYLENTINVLDCDHAFHWKCLENYTKNHNTKCPHCNTPMSVEPESN